MFHGSVQAHSGRSSTSTPATGRGDDIYVGCSGNFTIERVLHGWFGASRRVHGNDIQAYSCAIGWWMAGQPLNFTLRAEYEEVLGWLSGSLGTDTEKLATLMLGTRFLQWLGRHGVYYQRMINATREQLGV